jgi:hypothetical protein
MRSVVSSLRRTVPSSGSTNFRSTRSYSLTVVFSRCPLTRNFLSHTSTSSATVVPDRMFISIVCSFSGESRIVLVRKVHRLDLMTRQGSGG